MDKILVGALIALVVVLGVFWVFNTGQKRDEQLSSQPKDPVTIVNVDGGSYQNIDSAQLAEMLKHKDFFFINVHMPYEGEIAYTDAFIPYNEIEKNLAKLPSDKAAKIVVYCRSGRMSAIAAATLVKRGYTNVWNHKDGMIDWQNKGNQLIQKQS